MSSLALKLDEPDTLAEKCFYFLRDFLQPNTTLTLESTVQSIVKLLPEKAAPTTEFWTVGVLYIELAEQIPYNHPSQHKLASLVQFIGRSKKLFYQLDSGEPYFVHQRLKEALVDEQPVPDPEFPMQYANLLAFVANLSDLHIFGIDYTWAIWAQRAAHEEDPEENEHRAIIHDSNVLGAAQHILWAGQGFFKQVLYPGDVSSDDLKCWTPGRRYKGNAALSLDRWHFWKDGFNAVAIRENREESKFGQECKTAALKAANMMDALEKSMTC